MLISPAHILMDNNPSCDSSLKDVIIFAKFLVIPGEIIDSDFSSPYDINSLI